MKRPHVLICGGFGYVGHHLARYLSKKGFEVFLVGRGRGWLSGPNIHPLPSADLLNYATCENIVRNNHWIFNLAADVGGIGHITTHRAAGFSSATINTNLLRAIVNTKTKVAGYFLASSSCVYGEPPERGLCSGPGLYESHATFSTASEGYGQAKFFAERTCLAFKQEHGIPVRIGRYHSVYGPDENRPGKEHFIEALVKKVAMANQTGVHEIKIWGDGEQRRSLLYIDDCVEGTFRLMASEYSGPLNLAHASTVSVNGVVSQLEAIAGIKLARFYNYSAPVGVKIKIANLENMEKVLGWIPKIGTHEGLSRVWAAELF